MALKLRNILALLPFTGFVGATWNHDDYLSSPSPEQIPNPIASGANWEDAFKKAEDFVSQLTLEEKVLLVSGTEGPCVGNIAPIYRLNFTGLCLQNGPLGQEQGTYSSVFSAGLTIAATWDRDIAYKRGAHMGEEFRGKGTQIALGPVAGPLGRSAHAGRNWEGFSPDPYLTGELFSETIVGIQDQGVQACAKHFIGNEQETQRNPTTDANNMTIEAVSSNIDDRTMHELYLWPFQKAIKAGVATVMCSYNRLNQTYACQNSKALNGLLKEELGFQGYVMSDWGATHSSAYAVNAGEDMDMPGTASFGTVFFHDNLIKSINNGSVSVDRLDDMCRRVMTPYFHLKQDEGFPAIDPSEKDLNAVMFSTPDQYKYNFTFGTERNVDVRDNHGDEIRKAAAAGTVLLKNENNTLPLKSPKHIAVFGNDAGDVTNGMSVWYFNGISKYEYGVQATGGGSGSGLFTYIVSPLEAIKQKVGFRKQTLVQYVLNNTALAIEGNANIAALQPYPPDVCLVFLKTWSTEGEDRTSLEVDWDGDKVVQNVAANCSNTVVITHSGGINTMPWADHPNVTAILAAHLPGQEAGNSIVDVLWGDINPSGRLPYTIAKSQSDYDFAPITNSSELLNTVERGAWQADFEEGLLVDYRHFDYYNQSVLYEFGYGLSYTTFSLASDIQINSTYVGTLASLPASAKTEQGGNPNLWEVVYQITATVENTGSISGDAVPQLYLSLPQGSNATPTPKHVLRGFDKIFLKAGASATVTFDLTRRDISSWDVAQQQWVISCGAIEAQVGFSSRDFRASGSFTPIACGSKM